MQIVLKSHPFSRFQMAFSALGFSDVCCGLCVFFDKSSEATGYASLCVICQQEMNGYSQLTQGLCIAPALRAASMGEMSRGEQQRKI